MGPGKIVGSQGRVVFGVRRNPGEERKVAELLFYYRIRVRMQSPSFQKPMTL